MSVRAFIVMLAALGLIGLLTFGLVSQGSASIAVGDAAPDAELPLLDGSGTGSVGEHRGSWVLVNFWASWCAPCRDESPALQRFSERNPDDLVVLGINTQDLSDDATGFVDEFGLTYTMLRDPDSASPLSDDYGATGLPESFLVDPDGRLAAICRGPINGGELDEVIAPLIAGREVTESAEGSICGTAAE
jgi:cytochrome c biogenesis protein CcmG/thiol:disulfide interchange protein DsbE